MKLKHQIQFFFMYFVLATPFLIGKVVHVSVRSVYIGKQLHEHEPHDIKLPWNNFTQYFGILNFPVCANSNSKIWIVSNKKPADGTTCQRIEGFLHLHSVGSCPAGGTLTLLYLYTVYLIGSVKTVLKANSCS